MDSAPDRPLDEIDAERLIGALNGVVSAHVVTNELGAPVEIHVLATAELHPKQVVRNVESALSAGLGVPVDRRIISVAQIRTEGAGRDTASDEDPGVTLSLLPTRPVPGAESNGAEGEARDPALEPAPPRLEYVRHTARRGEDRCTCEVVLRADEEEVGGTGSGPDTEAGRAEAAVRAVFEAIGRARSDVELELEAVAFTSSREERFIIVSAHAVLQRRTVSLAGAARVGRSPEEGAILAALQASNRWSG